MIYFASCIIVGYFLFVCICFAFGMICSIFSYTSSSNKTNNTNKIEKEVKKRNPSIVDIVGSYKIQRVEDFYAIVHRKTGADYGYAPSLMEARIRADVFNELDKESPE